MSRSTAKFPAIFISAFVVIPALLCGTSSALADNDDFRFSITPYLWLPSVDNHLDVKGVPVEFGTNTSAFDILGKLDFALLVAGEARAGRFGVYYDFQALKLSDDGNLHRAIGNGYNYSTTIADSTLGLQFRVIDQPKFSLDALAGARVVYAEASVGINETRLTPKLDGDESKWWVDPIVGVKGSYRFNDKWALNGYADFGGFGAASRSAYQLLGTVSYRFNDHIAIQVGYRYWADDYDHDGFKLDSKLYGPVAGLTFSF
jgi:opacity protein-like surface antigen